MVGGAYAVRSGPAATPPARETTGDLEDPIEACQHIVRGRSNTSLKLTSWHKQNCEILPIKKGSNRKLVNCRLPTTEMRTSRRYVAMAAFGPRRRYAE